MSSANLERTAKFVGLFKDVLTATAILVGGLWALFRFNLFDAPFLQITLSTDLTAETRGYAPGLCAADIHWSVFNGSKASAHISAVQMAMWYYNQPEVKVAKPTLIDRSAVFDGPPAWELPEKTQKELAAVYDPTQAQSRDLTVVFPTPSESHVAIRVRYLGNSSQQEQLNEAWARTFVEINDDCR